MAASPPQNLQRQTDEDGGHLVYNPDTGHLVLSTCGTTYIQATDCDDETVHNLWFVKNTDGTIETLFGSKSLPFYFKTLSAQCLKVEEGNTEADTLPGTLASGYSEQESCEACDDGEPEPPCPDGLLPEFWLEVASGVGDTPELEWVPSGYDLGFANSLCASENPFPAWTDAGVDADGISVAFRYVRAYNPTTELREGCCGFGLPPQAFDPSWTFSPPPFPPNF